MIIRAFAERKRKVIMAKLTVTLDETLRKKYREDGFWGDATLLDYWKMSAKAFPEKVAVVDCRDKRYTFRELDAASDRVAAYLVNEAGVETGDIVSVQIPNWSEFTLVYLGILKAGGVISPLMPKFRESELVYRMDKCRAKVMFAPAYFHKTDHVAMIRSILPKLPDLKKVVFVDKDSGHDVAEFDRLEDILARTPPMERYVETDADDVAVVLFTSGTEARGKGVMLTHNNLAANMKGYLAMTQLNCTDAMLMPVPVAHATGLMYGVTVPFMLGYKSVLLEQFDAEESLKLIEQERCTAIEGPTVIAMDILRFLDAHPDRYDISSLRYFYCGGSPIPRTVVEKGLELDIHILGIYGATESAPHCVVAPFHSVEKVLTTDGRPVPGMEVKIVDPDGKEVPVNTEGEEYSRGPSVFVGYLHEPELTANAFDNGWYRSGDLCRMDADGYVRITGRKKNVIIRGGENISSTEVEGILLLHPNIKEAAVVAYPDERLGEKACACVTLRDAGQTLDMAAVQVHMASHNVAKYKWPERVEVLADIPKNDSGKVLKYQLRADIRAKTAPQAACMVHT